MVFHAFTFESFISNWIGSRSYLISESYVIPANIQQTVYDFLLQHNPSFIKDINEHPDVAFFSYDERNGRWIMCMSDMEITRGLFECVKEKITNVLPYVFVDIAHAMWMEEELLKVKEEPVMEKVEEEKSQTKRMNLCEWLRSLFE